MCGINGIFDRAGGPIDVELLERMMTVQKHRGPDGTGRLVDREVGLGHQRLSIIDVEGGAQPIDNEDGTISVVFNGELYNFIELRRELEGHGHVFKTHTDTEVIVHAYEQWGHDSVNRFNGMFAFAVWDSVRREVFLARDHLGVKPLYYTEIGDRFLFASEIKALLQDPSCPREVDVQSLADLFSFRYVPSPRTLFKDIFKLPPGHRMTVSSRGIEIDRFWTWIPDVATRRSEASLVEEYQELLEDAVRLQLRSDVPLGLFLSSGVDSGALLAIMSQFGGGSVKAFTIGFEEGNRTNEVDDARTLARMFGADHEYMQVTPDDYERYHRRYLWDLEEPVGNESAAAFYFVSHIASRRVKVALAGQGADEPWAGYDRHLGAKISAYYSRVPSSVTGAIDSIVARVPGRFEQAKRSAAALGEPDELTRFAKMYSFFSPELKDELFLEDLKEQLTSYEPKESLRHLHDDVASRDPLTQMLYMDTRSNLPDDLLMVGDKMSMANSLEARVPYLDYRLVEFIERLPPELKLRQRTGKYLHKQALQKWLPADVIHRKKKGFANPVEHWFRGRMRPFVEESLLSDDAAVRHYFDQGVIKRMLDQDRRGVAQYKRHIYLLVAFELWHRRFIDA